MRASESKSRFFTKRIDSHNESNRFESRIGMLCCIDPAPHTMQTVSLGYGGTDCFSKSLSETKKGSEMLFVQHDKV